MKFSWKLLNSFIDLKNININDFRDQLTLSGIEIEKANKDIIEISTTTNRKEISSLLSLARETSTIFNLPLRILPINIQNYDKKIFNNSEINYTKTITIKKNYINKTPQWLLSEIITDNIQDNNLIINIQKYIKMKWGTTFEIKNTKLSHRIYKINQKLETIIFTKISDEKSTNNYTYEFHENMYVDSVKLISTLTRSQIGKCDEQYKKVQKNSKYIKIKKDNINILLGNMNGENLKFIETNTIINILERLNLKPHYKKLEKAFLIQIPHYRQHDLYREIDIIEEIGRIYKFQYLFDQITKYNLKGFKSPNFIKIKNIRKTLQNLGLHEVINCCLTNNITNKNNIMLYNPISNEQTELRSNVLENIIQNYKENIKHSQKNIEIFEISKIFEKSNKKYKETQRLGGLIYNTEHNRNNWEDQPKTINLFHFKNTIEIFLKKINSATSIKVITDDNSNKNTNKIGHLFNKNKKLGIYNIENNEIIGVIGEINKNIIQLYNNKKIYIFEINLEKLILTIKQKSHLNYIIQKYSNYPSVTRDISVKLKKYMNIEQVKKILLDDNNSLIESIDMLNEYKKVNDYRSISLRITYRSISKTLTKEDIKYVDQSLEQKLKKLSNV